MVIRIRGYRSIVYVAWRALILIFTLTSVVRGLVKYEPWLSRNTPLQYYIFIAAYVNETILLT
jgi:hypothetical protein